MSKKSKSQRPGKIVSVDEYFDNLSEGQMDSLVTAAMDIANENARAEREIRDLLLANEDKKALKLMRKYLGI